MRGLEFQDIFTMSRILAKAEINKEIENFTKRARSGENLDTEAVGIEFIMTVFAKATTKEIEKEIYAFLGDVFEIKPEEIRHMKPAKVVELFKETDLTEWKDFFISVVRFLKAQS